MCLSLCLCSEGCCRCQARWHCSPCHSLADPSCTEGPPGPLTPSPWMEENGISFAYKATLVSVLQSLRDKGTGFPLRLSNPGRFLSMHRISSLLPQQHSRKKDGLRRTTSTDACSQVPRGQASFPRTQSYCFHPPHTWWLEVYPHPTPTPTS